MGFHESKSEYNAPVARIACTILEQAMHDGATEVRLEPTSRHLSVRFVIGDEVHEVAPLPVYVATPLIVRFKVMSNLHDDPSGNNRAEGRVHWRLGNKDYEFAASIATVAEGESLILHLAGQRR